jgi:hypothetical protein
MKHYFKVMQIHSSCSSASSCDEFLYKEIASKEANALGKQDIKYCSDRLIEIFYLEDKTFYHRVRNDASKEEMKSLVDKYAKEDYQTKRPLEIDEYWKRCDERTYQLRIKKGYVITDPNYDYNNYNRDDFKGSLSNELWILPNCVKYTSKPCFGYYGHSARTHKIDLLIESEFKKNKASLEEIHVWMSSSYARHALDWKEGASITVWKEYVKENIKNWIKQAKEMITEESK